MIAKTSSEAYEEYQRLIKIEEKLEKANYGLNILNASSVLKPRKFYIEVKNIRKGNLVTATQFIDVKTDLPFSSWSYRFEACGIKEFIQELADWVSIPRYEFFVQHNRKYENKISLWDLPKFRVSDIKFEDVDFDIGEEAEKEIKKMGFDFKEEVKNILSQQREANKQEGKDFERFVFLSEEIDNLKRQIGTRTNYGWSSGGDETLKITLDKEIYNKRLIKIKEELEALCEKYSFFKMPSIYLEDVDEDDGDDEDEDEGYY